MNHEKNLNIPLQETIKAAPLTKRQMSQPKVNFNCKKLSPPKENHKVTASFQFFSSTRFPFSSQPRTHEAQMEQMWSLLRIKYIVPCSLSLLPFSMNFMNQFALVCCAALCAHKKALNPNNNKERKVKFNKFNNCHNFDWKVIFLLKISSFEQFDAWLNQPSRGVALVKSLSLPLWINTRLT